MNRKIFSECELLYIKNNYVKLGRKECAKYLGRSSSSVKSKALRLGIKNTKEETSAKQLLRKKTPGTYSVDER